MNNNPKYSGSKIVNSSRIISSGNKVSNSDNKESSDCDDKMINNPKYKIGGI